MVPHALGAGVCLPVEAIGPAYRYFDLGWDHPMAAGFSGIEHLSKTVVPVLIHRSGACILLPDRDKCAALA
jgi:hypothetical protein